MNTEWHGVACRQVQSVCIATGLPIKLVDAEALVSPVHFNTGAPRVCTLLRRADGSCAGRAARTQKRLFSLVRRSLSSHITHCDAGLTLFAVPVVINYGLVAVFLGGKVLDYPPCEGPLPRFFGQMEERELRCDLEIAAAYRTTPFLAAARIRATLRVLEHLALSLAESASRGVLAHHTRESAAVTRAKDFVENRLAEPIHLVDAAAYVHLEPHYFCRLFHKESGITFGEYVTRCRIEQVKQMLADHAARISDIAFACGFGSIPHFNRIFRRWTGLSPTEYRSDLSLFPKINPAKRKTLDA